MRKLLVIARKEQRLEELAEKIDASREIELNHQPDKKSDREGEESGFDTVVIDINSLLNTGRPMDEALEKIFMKHPSASVVVVAKSDQSQQAIAAVKAGAFDYLTHPVEKEELELVIERAHEADILHSELDYLRDQFWGEDYRDVVQTKSKSMRDVLRKVQQVANTRTTVLLSGETGTGKTLMARMIHAHSERKNDPFISLHCGAIPDTLVESEFFGHEKGAFTGAIKRKLGKFELAKSGTIFLDEIGTVSATIQIKLLDVLQERKIQRIGGESSIPLDVRIIAATNDDLDELCAKGFFRRDLFYRLNVFPIVIPPLRERKEDIFHLSNEFIKQFSTQLNKNITNIAPEVMDAFLAYQWPGNVRELENIIERACILEQSEQLRPASFPIEFFRNDLNHNPISIDIELPIGQARQIAIDSFERGYLTHILTLSRGVIKNAAQKAGITTRQFSKLMKKHNLCRDNFTNNKN